MNCLTRIRPLPIKILTSNLVLCLVTLLTACSQTIDNNKVELAIKNGLTEKTGIAVNTVSCPSEIEIKANNIFECEVNAENNRVIIAEVTQTNNQGNISWQVNQGLLTVATIEEQIKTGVSQQLNIEVTADCGNEKFKIAFQGETFNCETKDKKGNPRLVNVLVEDNKGSVSWKIVQTGILDNDRVENYLRDRFPRETGIAVNSVSCPSGIEIKPNDTFECKVKVRNNRTVITEITQTDNQGNISWQVSKGLISIASIQQQIQADLSRQLNGSIKADCGRRKFKIATPGETFNCRVRDASGRRRRVKVLVDDEAGNVSWQLR